ncbi:MAG TPA: hypothetical protein VNE62_12665 [Actinomycetota bacterium]|nr:hypothetical protein [Actinomycetota bacterium]
MPFRRKPEIPKPRTAELKQKAAVFAEEGGEALKEFSSTTGSAAKEFATTAYAAAKELLDVVEKAGDRLEKQSKPVRTKSHKLLKTTLAIGVGAAIFTNEKVRALITSKLGGGPPEPWTPPSSNGSESTTTEQPTSKTTP